MCFFKFQIHQNPFSAGAPPWTPVGELMMLPQIPIRLGRGHRELKYAASYTLTHALFQRSFSRRIQQQFTPTADILSCDNFGPLPSIVCLFLPSHFLVSTIGHGWCMHLPSDITSLVITVSAYI